DHTKGHKEDGGEFNSLFSVFVVSLCAFVVKSSAFSYRPRVSLNSASMRFHESSSAALSYFMPLMSFLSASGTVKLWTAPLYATNATYPSSASFLHRSLAYSFSPHHSWTTSTPGRFSFTASS